MPARMHAVVQHAFGGPEVLEYTETDVPEPGPGRCWSGWAPPP